MGDVCHGWIGLGYFFCACHGVVRYVQCWWSGRRKAWTFLLWLSLCRLCEIASSLVIADLWNLKRKKHVVHFFSSVCVIWLESNRADKYQLKRDGRKKEWNRFSLQCCYRVDASSSVIGYPLSHSGLRSRFLGSFHCSNSSIPSSSSNSSIVTRSNPLWMRKPRNSTHIIRGSSS